MRREFPQKVRAAAFKRCGGKCEQCDMKIMRGGFHYDHIKMDALGGEPTLENCKVLCTPCHKAKTRDHDMPLVRKADAMAKAHRGTGKVKARIPSPPKAKREPRSLAAALPPIARKVLFR